MKLTDNYMTEREAFTTMGIEVPTFDQVDLVKTAKVTPTWVHFGGGNLFRGFHSEVAQKLVAAGELPAGVIVAETYDDAVIQDVYRRFDNRHLNVTMKADGSLKRELIASVSGSYTFNRDHKADWQTMMTIFAKPSLQLATFSITEKGYNLRQPDGYFTNQVLADLATDPHTTAPGNNMVATAALLLHRFETNATPIAMVSTDNFSQNGDRLRETMQTIAKMWETNGFVGADFMTWLNQDVTFPLSMIDRITPNPAASVAEALQAIGFADTELIRTPKGTNVAPFANTEEVHYLVIEDNFPNGRPDFTKAGVFLTDRATVNDADAMNVTTSLNPLHTALAIFGSLLNYDSIAEEMKNVDLLKLIQNIGYVEGLPVVTDPGIISPKQFIDEVINKRLPNPYIPDTPQRIATDTSQKLSIRFGETIKAYVADEHRDVNDLVFIPLTLAAWVRYLMAVDDNGQQMALSPDPLLATLLPKVAPLHLGYAGNLHDVVVDILQDEQIFGVDLYEVGLGVRVENDLAQLLSGEGAVACTLHNALAAYGRYDVAEGVVSYG